MSYQLKDGCKRTMKEFKDMNFKELLEAHKMILYEEEETNDSMSNIEELSVLIEEYINKVVDMRSDKKELMDIFSLHSKISICEIKDGRYNYTDTGKHTYYSMRNISLNWDEFNDCETDEEIKDTFIEVFEEILKENLL